MWSECQDSPFSTPAVTGASLLGTRQDLATPQALSTLKEIHSLLTGVIWELCGGRESTSESSLLCLLSALMLRREQPPGAPPPNGHTLQSTQRGCWGQELPSGEWFRAVRLLWFQFAPSVGFHLQQVLLCALFSGVCVFWDII